MAFSVFDEGDWNTNVYSIIYPGGNPITQLGLYRLWIDTSNMLIQTAGTVRDSIRVTAQVSVNSGEPLRVVIPTTAIYAGSLPPTWRSPDIECGDQLLFTVWTYNIRVQPVIIPWKLFRAF